MNLMYIYMYFRSQMLFSNDFNPIAQANLKREECGREGKWKWKSSTW